MENCTEFEAINNDETLSTTEAFGRMSKIQEKIKYQAFGKVKFKKGFTDNELKNLYNERNKLMCNINDDEEASKDVTEIDQKIAKQIIETQRKELVKEIESIHKMKHSKGIVGAVFDVRNKILGNKKKPDQEATAVINFRTKELEVSPQKIERLHWTTL